MNRILRFIYAALIVSTAVACHTSEIDNPNNDNQDKPKAYDNIILTASIKQTRVDYSINGDKLEQRWAENDVIYGFYGGSTANKVVFSVESVDEETGVASLKPESGWSGFLSAFNEVQKSEGPLKVGLVYTGCTTIPSAFQNDGIIEVDMTSQGTDRIPACMHANNYYLDTKRDNDVTYIQFLFDNDCSIIEVFSFTGVALNSETYFSGDKATLNSIQVAGLIENCTYTLNGDGGVTFNQGETTNTTTVTLGGSWSVTKDGDITYAGNIKPVFIAAVPFEGKNFSVSANLDNGKEPIIQSFNNKTFVGGNSYYIMANPVIAKTVDNVYFKTVNDAFEHAEYLNDYDLLQGRTNTVTLLVDEIYGLGDQDQDDPVYDTQITIDYDVTLDLNGFVLYIDESESFIVKETGDFTITDSRYDDKVEAGIWSWTTEEDVPVIKNFGRTSITSAYVFSDNLIVDNKGGVLDVVGSDIQSYAATAITNTGKVKISNSTISSGNGSDIEEYTSGDYVIENEGICSLEIINSTIKFEDESSKYDKNQTATIYFYNDQVGEDKEASFTMMGGEVQGGYIKNSSNPKKSTSEAIQLFGNVKATISDSEVNSYSFNAVTLAPIYADEEEEVVSVPAGELTITGNSTVSSLTGPGVIKNKEGNLTISGNCTVSSKSNDANYGAIDNVGGTIKIEGGKIESTTYALYTDKEATITKGELISSGYNAIICWGGTLCIGDKNNANPDNNDILIKSSTVNYSPAIDMLEGTMDVYYGKIIGNGGGAVWLEPVDLELPSIANIHGGYFENADLPTIQVRDGSACTITGGVIYNSGRNSAAVLCCSVKDSIATLKVKWSNGTGPEHPGDDKRHEPLIVSAGINAPISAFLDRDFDGNNIEDNTADIQIMGGYLISSGTQDAFYIDMEGNNLNLESNDGIFNFGNFYSNKTKVTKDGSSPGASNNTIDLYNGGSGNKIFDINTGEKFKAIPQNVKEEDDEEDEEDEEDEDPQLYSFTMPIIGGDSGGLYKIEKM